VPERIGKYEIIKEVARGSTGVVYLSHDPFYGRDVAIKAYHVDAGDDPERASLARKLTPEQYRVMVDHGTERLARLADHRRLKGAKTWHHPGGWSS
jgi:serine/threonine protein kinase